MKLLKYIFSIVFLVQVLFALAQFENADAEFLSMKKVYTLHKDGSWDYHYSHKLKLNTHYSFHRLYGETFIVINPEYQSLKINKTLTTMADGTIVASPDNAFNEVLPRVAKDAPAYNHLREMVVTHTGLEVGAMIDLDYEIHNQKGFSPALMGMEVFGTDSPIHEMTVEIIVPKGVELNFTFRNMRLGPNITEQKNTKIYSWKAKGLSQITHERYSGADYEQHPVLIFSQEDMFKVFNRFVNQDAFRCSKSDLFSFLIQKIKKENADDLGQVLAIQDVVVNTVNHYHVPLSYAAYKIRTPEQVWESNGGTSMEKATLLTCLLKQAGYKATTAVFFPNHMYNKEYGVLSMISDVVVRVQTKSEGMIYLSPTHQGKQSAELNLGKGTLLFLDAAVESLQTKELSLPQENTYCSIDVKIDETGTIEGKASIKLKGNHVPYLSLKKDEKNLYKMLPGFNKEQVKNVNLRKLEDKQVSLSLQFVKDQCWKDFEGYKVIELPAVKSSIDRLNLSELARERKTGIDLGKHYFEEFEYTIELPKGYEMVGKLTDLEVKNVEGVVQTNLTTNGNKITIKRSLDLREYFLKPGQVKNLMKLMEMWDDNSYRKIILKKTEK